MWYQLQIEHCHRDEVDSISDALDETGALSITLTDKNDNPVLEPAPGTTPLWPDVIVTALYTDPVQAELARESLRQQYKHLSYHLSELADQDWERAWMENFKPQSFGERLWICPSWIEPPVPDAVNLILDPGLAFGTGTHPTTALCLSWLDQASLDNKSVIDYGCGSGILALAALKLGAAKVQAVDIDEQALQATTNNALTNSVDPTTLQIGFPEQISEPADLIIANILLAPLTTLAERFKTLLNAKGTLVVSGLLEEQASQLIEIYEPVFNHKLTVNKEGWALVVFGVK